MSQQRLASFRSPPPQHPTPPRHQSSVPSTFHRKTKALLYDLRSIARLWDDLLLIDGLNAARLLVDTRTDLQNALTVLAGNTPSFHLVRPKLATMDDCILKLDVVLNKLQKQFQRMINVIDNFELLLIDAHKVKGSQWVQQEPLWLSWPLETFVNRISAILKPYHRSLALHITLVDQIRSHSISFEASRRVINTWVEQPCLHEEGWQAIWEDICEAEVERWDTG